MRILPHILLPVLAGALLAGCSPHPRGQVQGYLEGEYVYVAAPLGGALTKLAVARGDSVRPGQPLFELERESEAAALAQAEKKRAQAQAQLNDLTKGQRPTEIASLAAQRDRVRADLKLAATQLARREKLDATDVVSREELDMARAMRDATQARVLELEADLATAQLGAREDAVAAAQAAVAAQQAARDRARWAFDQKQQFAPCSARVHDTLYRQGEWVGAGNPVVVLLPPGSVKVRFFVPQGQLSQVGIGRTVSVHCDGAPRPFSATINYISTRAEYTPPVIFSRETRANLVFMIEAVLAPADAEELRPGQPAEVEWK